MNYLSFARGLHLFSTKLFVRWMSGTCVETPPQKIPGEDKPFIFNFFNDIAANTDVINLVPVDPAKHEDHARRPHANTSVNGRSSEEFGKCIR